MELGHRDVRQIVKAPFEAGHWRALIGMARVYPWPDLPGNLVRYLRRAGRFPRDCTVKTPVGRITVRLDTPDDLLTVNEVFAREDYRSGPDLRVAVDIGANIGLASLYVLTRNPASKVYCVEPDPKNVARLKAHLAPYEGRWQVAEVALDTTDGTATFYTEPSGRYGGLGQGWKSESITVPTRSVTGFLDEVLGVEACIGLLKIDVEGLEEKLLDALRPDQLDRIDRICYETTEPHPVHADRFDHHFGNQVNTLVRRNAAPSTAWP